MSVHNTSAPEEPPAQHRRRSWTYWLLLGGATTLVVGAAVAYPPVTGSLILGLTSADVAHRIMHNPRRGDSEKLSDSQ